MEDEAGALLAMIRIQRHPLGPRVYVLGRRLHEWHLGVVTASVTAVSWELGLVHMTGLVVLLFASGWLVAKDWRDLFPATRDTAAWRLGIHRRATRLRAAPRGDWLPPLTGTVVALTGLVNIASTLTPTVEWRARLLHGVEPVEAIPVFHALALPLGAALVIAAVHLARRKRRAWQAAIVFLVLLGAFDLLKGLDVEEALLSWAVVWLLWWGRSAFYVQHDPVRLLSAIWKLPAVAMGAFGVASVAAFVADPDAGPRAQIQETFDLLTWSAGPERFADELSWLPIGVGLVSALALVVSAYVVFRPLAAPRSLPDPELRRAAAELVAGHGTDTLAYFKLRRDAHYLFSPDGQAFVGYRAESGVLLVSGDPVGPDDALPGLLREVFAFADARGLEVAALGASERTLPLWRAAGLRALYIGDEAVVDTRLFSLEGRGIRKVRQSVARLERAGYRAELVRAEALDGSLVDELDQLSGRWRADAPERGFTMAMDSLRGKGGLVVVARDESGAVRGFQHYSPIRLAASDLAIPHAPGPVDPEWPFGVPRGSLDRTRPRARRARGVA